MTKSRREQLVPFTDAPERRKALVVKWLTSGASLIGAVDCFPEFNNEQYLSIGLSSASLIMGRLFMLNGRPAASIDYFEVVRRFQGHGLGERLLKSYVKESVQRGAETLWSEGVSNKALGLRVKLFGEQALQFYDTEHPELGFLPFELPQAHMTNDRINNLDEQDPHRRQPQGHLGVAMDLTALDTANWPSADVITLR